MRLFPGKKNLILMASSLCLSAAWLSGCTSQNTAATAGQTAETTAAATGEAETVMAQAESDGEEKELKYIFLFIGDGMSYPQIQAASYYRGAVASSGGVETDTLGFMEFPVAGSAQTFDSTSFAPDSASTATSIATGYKTHSGTINMDITKTQAYEAISEKLKNQKDYKVGVITSVNLNHATPAAFYAHQASRGNYYEIGLEMIDSGFDYFAGGELLKPDGAEGNSESLYTLAEQAGYQVVRTQQEAEALTAGADKAIVITDKPADAGAFSYEMDAADGEWVLADYVKKGIEVLDNDNGFFMMVEGGKIDWAGHANDAAANIHDTVALSNAVDEAISFYQQHPDETLILVTGDHETGGMTIGFAGTDYDTFLTNLERQKISYAKYDSDYVSAYAEKGITFEDAMSDVKELFGLMLPQDADAEDDSKLVLTEYETEKLREAFERTIAVGTGSKDEMTEEEYLLYGTYQPFTVTVTHLLNQKSGIGFTSYAHTGLPVPVFAVGNGESEFEGYYDNTDIYKKLAGLTNVE